MCRSGGQKQIFAHGVYPACSPGPPVVMLRSAFWRDLLLWAIAATALVAASVLLPSPLSLPNPATPCPVCTTVQCDAAMPSVGGRDVQRGYSGGKLSTIKSHPTKASDGHHVFWRFFYYGRKKHLAHQKLIFCPKKVTFGDEKLQQRREEGTGNIATGRVAAW